MIPPMPRATDRLLDAAFDLVLATGLGAVSLTDVARRAGVSRATAYRELGGKDALLAAIGRREIGRMFAAGLRRVDVDAPLEVVLRDAVLFALDHVRAHPIVSRVRTREPEWLIGVAVPGAGPGLDLVAMATAALAPILAENPRRDALTVPVPHAAEIAVRTVLSHVLVPGSAMTDEQIADAVVRAVTR